MKKAIEIIRHFLRDNVDAGLNFIARRCPNWLFKFNKARLMRSKNFEYRKAVNPEIKIKIADLSYIDDIVRISGIDLGKIRYLLNAGVTCFLGSIGNTTPTSIGWNVFGKCYIKGMGFEYDFGKDGAYGFWALTLPEARGRGLHYALMAAKAHFAKERQAKYMYSLIEFDNNLAYNIRLKAGYKPVLEMIFIKLFSINFLRLKNIETGKIQIKGFYKQPRGDIVII